MTAQASTRRSAGLLLFRRHPLARNSTFEVLLGHMGGPFWSRKDERAWSIPKGEHPPDEDAFDAARREFMEELGLPAPDGPVIDLGNVRQSGGKVVAAWAVEADVDVSTASSNTFVLEWPRGSGVLREFPEMDRFEWFGPDVAREKLVAAQVAFLDRLSGALGEVPDGS